MLKITKVKQIEVADIVNCNETACTEIRNLFEKQKKNFSEMPEHCNVKNLVLCC